jgi:hypothetical protein
MRLRARRIDRATIERVTGATPTLSGNGGARLSRRQTPGLTHTGF